MKPLDTLEQSLRNLFERLGAKLDSAVKGSNNNESAALRTLLSKLLPVLHQAIDDNLRTQAQATLAPHRIQILLDYGTFAQFSPPALRAVKEELATTIKLYINDRRYRLEAPLNLSITYDPIVRTPQARVSFTNDAPPQASATVTNVGYRLRAVGGPIAVSADLLDLRAGQPITIGRGRDNHLVLDDGSVSKFHATLAVDAHGRLMLADCGSTNGTYINGHRIELRSEVKAGDTIGIGDVELRLEKQL